MTHGGSDSDQIGRVRLGRIPVALACLLIWVSQSVRADVPAIADSAVSEQDSLALVAFYNATNGSEWVNNSGWLTDRVHEWYGIQVKDGRVVEIRMEVNGVNGSLPEEIGDLDSLEVLHLTVNGITGPLPETLTGLTRLRELILVANPLETEIPGFLGEMTSLEKVVLADNSLPGPIPPGLGSLTNLRELQLQDNQLTGSIPDELMNLDSLETLTLFNNQLTGEIPSGINRLGALRDLSIGGNPISGSLPPEIGELTELRVLDVYGTDLSGPLPMELTRLTKLESFSYWASGLCAPTNPEFTAWLESLDFVSGEVTCDDSALPGTLEVDSLGLVALFEFSDGPNWERSDNWLAGPVGSWYGVLVEGGRVRELDLVNNGMHGTIPVEIGQIYGLRRLVLAGNDLWGPFPDNIAFLDGLQEFAFGGNRLCVNSSVVQDWIESVATSGYVRNCPDLTAVVLEDSLALRAVYTQTGGTDWQRISGWDDSPVTFWDSVETRAGRVAKLYVHGNNLHGDFPASVVDLTALTMLRLDANGITGTVPEAIGSLTALTRLQLNDTELSGPLPSSLTSLDLEVFRFDGTGLCEPEDDAFQAWIATIAEVSRTGVGCDGSILNASEDDTPVQPIEFRLIGNYPNPFNPSTLITYEVPRPERVQIAVYDLTGRLIEILVDLQLVPGRHEARFEAGDLPSGVYIYRMRAGDYVASRKLLLAK